VWGDDTLGNFFSRGGGKRHQIETDTKTGEVNSRRDKKNQEKNLPKGGGDNWNK